MNRWPRPEDALAVRLRGMTDSIRGLLNGQANMSNVITAQQAEIAELQERITALEAQNNQEGES